MPSLCFQLSSLRFPPPCMILFHSLFMLHTRCILDPTKVNVGNKYNRDAGLSGSCLSRQGDFQTLPFEDAEFDAAYQIEATCHSPNKVKDRIAVALCCRSHTKTIVGMLVCYTKGSHHREYLGVLVYIVCSRTCLAAPLKGGGRV